MRGRTDRLVDRHALQHHAHFLQHGTGRQTHYPQLLAGLHHGQSVAFGQRLYQREHMAGVYATQHVAHRALKQLAVAKSNRLIGERQGVTHGAARRTGDQAQGLGVSRDVFGRQHLFQVLDDGFSGHGSQIELQTARQHRHRHFVRVGGGQHKFQIIRWLLQRLEHGVKGVAGEHVHLVDHEHLEAPLHRLVDRLLQQLLDFVHAAVGGRVKLGVVDKMTGVDVGASSANAARLVGDAGFAVERFSQNARHRGLADTAGAGEQIGVMQALRTQGIGQRLHNMRLTHQLFECFRTVFASEHQIGHNSDSTGRTISLDGPSRMVKRPTGSGGEPSSPNCGASAGVKARQLSLIPAPDFLHHRCQKSVYLYF